VHTIALIAQKGGAGKTTVALGLAVAAVQAGRRVALIDTDPQANAAKWDDRRESGEPWVVAAPGTRIKATVEQARAQGVELVLIDTPPHTANEALAAARAADLVIVPVHPHLFDIETLQNVADLLKLGGSPRTIAVMNRAYRRGDSRRTAARAVAELGFTVATVTLHHHVAHEHAANVGLGPTEFEPQGRAAHEILQLYKLTNRLLGARHG
jgi:chromosome partitioning protein